MSESLPSGYPGVLELRIEQREQAYNWARALLAKMPGVSIEAVLVGAREAGTLFNADRIIYEASQFELERKIEATRRQHKNLQARANRAFSKWSEAQANPKRCDLTREWKKYKVADQQALKCWNLWMQLQDELSRLREERLAQIEAEPKK